MISELVQTEENFVNRAMPLNDSMSYEPYDDFFLGNRWGSWQPGLASTLKRSFTEYRDLPTLLIDKAYAVDEPFMGIYMDSYMGIYLDYFSEFWILGSNYNVFNISAKHGIECGDYSCYEKSSREGKICQPGTF